MNVHYITNEPCFNTTAYPTCRAWSRDSRYIFVESDRARPDGTKKPVERQLLKIDAQTGETAHLATLELEDTKPYGAGHIRCSTQFHFDYAPEANVLVYYDMTGHNLYLVDADTGKSARILHEPEGTIGDPPGITPDGKRVVYYVIYPSIANRFLSGRTSVVFYLDVDPEKMQALGEPKVVTAYAGRVSDKALKDRFPGGIIVNHCQVNPKDPEHFCFAHEFGGRPPEASLTYTRTWENRGGIDRPVYRSRAGEWETHELIGPLGKSLYFVQNWGISRVDFADKIKHAIYDNKEGLNPCHITVSPDEKWIAADMWDHLDKPDENGCFRSGILLIEAATGKSKVLCRINRGQSHPLHPHPNFSPDGAKVAFTVAEGTNRGQVAYVDISDVIKNWGK
ncbi:MAG TPA: hypothetical protein VHS28_08900 [Chloroflexota bacterium]|nr:hypothetical protein [Chloroflexota bacterium]